MFFGLVPTAHEFQITDVFRTTAFGASIGGITGLTFGFMDGLKSVQESASLKTLSNSAKGSYIFKTCTGTSLIFGGFFAGFHMAKYSTRLVFNSSDEFQVRERGEEGRKRGGEGEREEERKQAVPWSLKSSLCKVSSARPFLALSCRRLLVGTRVLRFRCVPPSWSSLASQAHPCSSLSMTAPIPATLSSST